MYRVNLTEEAREELLRRSRATGIMPRTYERLQMVLLADAGWRVPKIAKLLRRTEPTVRYWLQRFLRDGFDALPDQPHLGQSSALPAAKLAALREEMALGTRTWTLPQAAWWLEEKHKVTVSPSWLGELMRREGWSYKRTQRRLKHKQDPETVAAKREELANAEKRALPAS